MEEIYAKFTSLNDEKAKDFQMKKIKIIVGRKKSCDIVVIHAKLR
jgi:hypothetical protein